MGCHLDGNLHIPVGWTIVVQQMSPKSTDASHRLRCHWRHHWNYHAHAVSTMRRSPMSDPRDLGKNGHQVVSLEVFLQNLVIKTYRRISCRRSRHVLTQVPDRMLQVNSVLAEVQKCTHSWAKVPFSSHSSGTKISPLTSGVVLGFRCCKHRLAPTHQHISHEGWWSPPPAWRSASSWGISQARGHLDLLQEWDHHLGESALTSMLIPTIVLLHVLHQLPNHQRENTGWVFSPCAWKGLAWKQWYVFHPKSL